MKYVSLVVFAFLVGAAALVYPKYRLQRECETSFHAALGTFTEHQLAQIDLAVSMMGYESKEQLVTEYCKDAIKKGAKKFTIDGPEF